MINILFDLTSRHPENIKNIDTNCTNIEYR